MNRDGELIGKEERDSSRSRSSSQTGSPSKTGVSPGAKKLPDSPSSAAQGLRSRGNSGPAGSPSKRPERRPSEAGSRSSTPIHEFWVKAIESEYENFTKPISPGREKNRSEILEALKDKSLFDQFKPKHFAVLLAISPDQTSALIAEYFATEEERLKQFIAMMKDPVVKPLEIAINRSEFNRLINNWIQSVSFDQKLIECTDLVQWMFLNQRLEPRHWKILLENIIRGNARNLLRVPFGLGATLWQKLSKHFSSTPDVRNLFWKDEAFLAESLTHFSMEQRVALFESAEDVARVKKLFELCETHQSLQHLLYSVLGRCFSQIKNEAFYQVLVRYPACLSYAVRVANPEHLSAFSQVFSDKPWFVEDSFKKKSAPGEREEVFSSLDKARIIRDLSSRINDPEASGFLPDILIQSYFNCAEVGLRLLILANPVFLGRVLTLSDNKGLEIDLENDIFPLMRWMSNEVIQKKSKVSVQHILDSAPMRSYFVSAIELLFLGMSAYSAQSPSEYELECSQLLLRFFKYFGEHYFDGITYDQISDILGLNALTAKKKNFADGFSKAYPAKMEAFRFLKKVKSHDLAKRWSETENNRAAFIAEFQYAGKEDVERWMNLLLGQWSGRKRPAVLAKVLDEAQGLKLADFLKEIRATSEIDILFKKQPAFAQRVLIMPNVIAQCRFSLPDFQKWDPCLLVAVIADPKVHKAYGFTAQDFQQLLFAQEHVDSNGEESVFLKALFSAENITPYARTFLVNAVITSPRAVKEKISSLVPKKWLENEKEQGNPWRAQRVPYRKYQFNDHVKTAGDQLSKHLSTVSQSPDSKGTQWRDYFRKVEQIDAIFLFKLLKQKDIRDKCQEEMRNVQNAEEAWNEVVNATPKTMNALVNENPLLRRVGIMRNPLWLELSIKSCRDITCVGLGKIVESYLLLPGFKPITDDLLPPCLLRDEVNDEMLKLVHSRPLRMVEYLIDLCHHPLKDSKETENKGELIKRAQTLVALGIETYFKSLKEAKDEVVQRWLCLICSATELLEPQTLLDIFNQNKNLRNHLCRLLLGTNLSALAVERVPAILRLQMLMLRSFAQNLALPNKPTEAELEDNRQALPMINKILWQCRSLPASALKAFKPQSQWIQSSYALDAQTLRSLPPGSGLVSVLAAEELIEDLSKEDLNQMVGQDQSGAVERACSFYPHLSSKCAAKPVLTAETLLNTDGQGPSFF